MEKLESLRTFLMEMDARDEVVHPTWQYEPLTSGDPDWSSHDLSTLDEFFKFKVFYRLQSLCLSI